MEKVSSVHVGAQAGVMLEDLSNLITWTHSHATICSHTPRQDKAFLTGASNRCIVAWQCDAGHAYHWPFTLPTEVTVKREEREKGTSVKRKRMQPPSLDEDEVDYMQMDTPLFLRKGSKPDFDGGHCSLVTPMTARVDSIVRKSEKATNETKVRKNKCKAMIQPLHGEIVHKKTKINIHKQDDGKIRHKKKVNAEHKKKDPNFVGEKYIVKKSIPEDESSELNENFTTTVEDPPAQALTISDTEDELWLTPQDGYDSFSSQPFNEGQREPQSQGSSSALPPVPTYTAHRPDPATANSPCDKGKVKTPRRTVEKKVPRKAKVTLGRLLTFDTWMAPQTPGSLPTAQLDKQLSNYFKYIRRESEGQSLTSGTLTSYTRTLDRSLQSQGCGVSLLKSPALSHARKELDACCQDMKRRESEGDMEVIQSLRPEEETSLRQSAILSRSTPEGLLNLVLVNNLRAFGRFHLLGAWPIRNSDFQLVTETHLGTDKGDDLEYLEWNPPNSYEQGPVRMHGCHDDLERCPLQDYKLYVSKRVGGFVTFNDAFYCKYRQCMPWDDNWYSRTPMTKSRLEKKISGLSQHILTIRKGRAGASVDCN